eukprot:490292-Amphidinium_carterae.4
MRHDDCSSATPSQELQSTTTAINSHRISLESNQHLSHRSSSQQHIRACACWKLALATIVMLRALGKGGPPFTVLANGAQQAHALCTV